ncbi:hypothetical protein OG285_36185 (plasmid) [Streptomyces sp. NBC_01471]|uniref:hypothetical protein n=1 Tax=Streptomyces sp. NBC_01471 TaxID=2903879 RepID=UPI002F910D14
MLNDSDASAVHDLPQCICIYICIWERIREVEADGEQAAAKTRHVGRHTLEPMVLRVPAADRGRGRAGDGGVRGDAEHIVFEASAQAETSLGIGQRALVTVV